MSVVRLAVTAGAMAAAAVALLLLAADPVSSVHALHRAPDAVAEGEPEEVVLALTGLLAWGTWAWGALGLLLTAAGGLPGLAGALARGIASAVLPQRLRAAAAVALGVGLAVAGPASAAPGAPSAPPDRPAVVTGPPDWPADPAGAADAADPADPADPADAADAADPADPALDGTPAPPARPTDRHVVIPGDCLWAIAADHLAARAGHAATDGEVAMAVAEWWAVNADVIGPDPDLVHPGQVLQAPPAGSDATGGSR